MKSLLYLVLLSSFSFFYSGSLVAQMMTSKIYLSNKFVTPRNISSSPIDFEKPESFFLTNDQLPNLPNGLVTQANVTLGVFLSDRILVKSDIAYTGFFNDNFPYDLLHLGTVARYYFKPGITRTNYFAEIGGSHFWGEGFLRNFFSAEVGAGISHLLTPSLALEGQVNYSRNENNKGNDGENYLFTLGLGLLLGKENGERSVVRPSVQKGTIMLGATGFQFGVFRQERGTGSVLSIQPSVLYFITDVFALGAGMYFGYDRSDLFEVTISTSGIIFKGYRTNVSAGITPKFRYQPQSNHRLRYFLESGVDYQFAQFTHDNINAPSAYMSAEHFQLLLQPALSYFITNRAVIELGPEFSYDFKEQAFGYGITLGFQALILR